MPGPNEKFKKHKKIRTPRGIIKRQLVKKKTGIHKCAICKEMLHGMPHGKRVFEVQKMSKTERRPEAPLASMICPICRKDVYLSAVLLKYNVLTKEEVDFRYIKYINMIIKKIE